MNRMKNILLIALGFALITSGCNKDEDPIEEQTPVGGNTVVSASFHWKWGLDDFDTAQTYITASGAAIRVDLVQFYLAQPSFEDDSDVLVAEFPTKYLLVDLMDGAAIQNIGELNGHLHHMHFTLGVDSITNHSDPALYPLDHPLSISNNMSWLWTAGYIFLKLEGRYDSDGDGDVDANDQPFTYHCVGDPLRRLVELEVHHDALTGGALVLDLDLDVAVLIGTTDIETNSFSEGENTTTRALMDNLASAITYP